MDWYTAPAGSGPALLSFCCVNSACIAFLQCVCVCPEADALDRPSRRDHFHMPTSSLSLPSLLLALLADYCYCYNRSQLVAGRYRRATLECGCGTTLPAVAVCLRPAPAGAAHGCCCTGGATAGVRYWLLLLSSPPLFSPTGRLRVLVVTHTAAAEPTYHTTQGEGGASTHAASTLASTPAPAPVPAPA